MIRFRGPNSSPGFESSTDRSGSSSSQITPTLRHPFAVQNMGVKDGNVHFAIHEGNVFTGSGAGQSLVSIDDETLSVVETVSDPLTLTNSNAPCTYKTAITAGEPKILYVRISRTLDDPEWKNELVAKTLSQIVTEINFAKPYFADDPEKFIGTSNTHGFPVTITTQRQHCGITYTVTATQQGKRYSTEYSWYGSFQYPVAKFEYNGKEVTCTQILRSDIFFPFDRKTTIKYTDTGINNLVINVEGECPCVGCGCGCGGGGCEPPPGCCGGCCGGGCCGGGCGCGCGGGCAPDLPPPTNPVPPNGGSGSGSPSGSNGGGNYSGLTKYIVEHEIPGTRGIAKLDDFSGPLPIYGPVSPKPASAFPLPNGTPATPGSPGTEYAYFRITKYRYERILGTSPDQSPASFQWNKVSDIYTINKLPYSQLGAVYSSWPP